MQHVGTARTWQRGGPNGSQSAPDASGASGASGAFGAFGAPGVPPLLGRTPSETATLGSLRLGHALTRRVPELVAAYSWCELRISNILYNYLI